LGQHPTLIAAETLTSPTMKFAARELNRDPQSVVRIVRSFQAGSGY